MRKAAGVLLVAILGALLLVVPAAWARTAPVTIRNFEFGTGSHQVFINPGDTVRWTHRDGAAEHTVSSDNDAFDSSPNTRDGGPCSLLNNDCLHEGDTFGKIFGELGTFPYHCKIHSSMTGMVKVVRKGSATTPPASTGPAVTPTKASVSPSPTGSGTGTRSVSPLPTITGSATFSPPPQANGGDGGSGNARIAIAAVGVLLLTGAGFLVYRRFIAPS